MSFTVDTDLLRRAATDWDDLGEHVDRAVRRLGACRTADTGRPSTELGTFLHTWKSHARQLSHSAQGHADALRSAARSYDDSDASARADLVRLLPRGGRVP